MVSANWASVISLGGALSLLLELQFCSEAKAIFGIATESGLSHSLALGP